MTLNAQLTGTWDGSQLMVIIGVLPITGLSDGDSVTARRMNPFYNSRAGNDGAVGRARVTDKRGEIEIRTMQTSTVNDELSALFNMDSLSEEGSIVLPFIIKDLSGTTMINAGQAWLQNVGDTTFESGAVGERIWTFAAADLKRWIGGNK